MSARLVRKRSFGRDDGGQIMVFAAMILFVLLCFLAVTFDVGSLIHKRISLQNAADASSLSGATWEAKGLNLLASLNQGIVSMFGAMTAYVVVTGISAYVFPALGSQLVRCMPDVLITLYTIAVEMAKIQKKIIQVTPYLVDGEALRIANANAPRAVAFPYPYDPGDPHTAKSALGLHVRRGTLKEVVRKILDKALEMLPEPVTKALDREPLKSFVKEPFYKAMEATAGSFAFDKEGGMTFEETKVVMFERGREEAGYPEFVSFMGKARDGRVKVGRGTEALVYNQEYYTLDPHSCREVSEGNTERTITRTTSLGIWGPEGPVASDLNSGKIPQEEDYVRKETWRSSGPCHGKVYKREEWDFLRFKAEVTEKKNITNEQVEDQPLPIFLDDDFTERQWLALIAWDTGESRRAPFLGKIFTGANFWGSCAVSQSRPRSPSTRDGELLWNTDWEARLTAFSAHEALAESMGKGSSRMKAMTEKLILH